MVEGNYVNRRRYKVVNMFKIGIMQGRLLPWYKNNYQSHPVNYWESEFYIAKDLGFNSIEFIYDYNESTQNPLTSNEGVDHIKTLIESTDVEVNSICADYFMEAPFHSENQHHSEKELIKLINSSKKINIKDIVIPCVDQSSLKSKEDIDKLVTSMTKILHIAEDAEIIINIETDMNPNSIKDFLQRFTSNNIKINYDSGNSASMGYDINQEFDSYGRFISDIHIKDRLLNGESVFLGTGDAKLKTLIQLIKKFKLNKQLIMQASRKRDYVDDLSNVRAQKKYLENIIKEVENEES